MHPRGPGESIEHTLETVERYVEVARQRGIDEIGFTEHIYYFRETLDFWTVPYQYERCVYGLDAYCDSVLEAKRLGLPVKLGLEVDWVSGSVEALAELLGSYAWDYLLGSIHYVDGLGIDSRPTLIEELGAERAWERYFDDLALLAVSGLVDVLAHPDLIKFFGRRVDELLLNRIHDRFIGLLGDTGVALEISTAGRYKPIGELYPDRALLERGLARGVPITLASDAHASENVGRDLEQAIALARDVGYTTITIFEGRQGRQELLG